MNLETTALPILTTGYLAHGGPLAGTTVYLSEHSRSSGYMVKDGQHGRYVVFNKDGNLGPRKWDRLTWVPGMRI